MKEKKKVAAVPAKKDKSCSFRINRDLHDEAVRLYGEMGLTLSDAINIFIQQSINVGGLPFELNSEKLASQVKKKAHAKLKKEIEEGIKSGIAK